MVGQTVYTHRIVGEENGMFTLKGDSNNTVDDTVSAGEFQGKVLLIIPKIGVAIVFFKRSAGMAFLALLLLLYIFGEDIYQKMQKMQKMRVVNLPDVANETSPCHGTFATL